ncbi:hypothetical protein HN992_01655 [Candidatus Woesearchaeota archaeon]|jgi:hypothetical protein|nr:hypothetical protein [Candidatus Woesearchaeota archaeon]MBT3438622.1 hypothetical protein [Candidatus Woesearchaeota archaeon]MBT4058480.1 hypothetical protein [Candidatus Woesearchaeota archaeon]MBT4207307.1 hypothetical protein [Candidatus Woesearchaeota archaeon]MBT4730964.1 hypothetical protein [Candidatus Woesearchaeota archaeon]
MKITKEIEYRLLNHKSRLETIIRDYSLKLEEIDQEMDKGGETGLGLRSTYERFLGIKNAYQDSLNSLYQEFPSLNSKDKSPIRDYGDNSPQSPYPI